MHICSRVCFIWKIKVISYSFWSSTKLIGQLVFKFLRKTHIKENEQKLNEIHTLNLDNERSWETGSHSLNDAAFETQPKLIAFCVRFGNYILSVLRMEYKAIRMRFCCDEFIMLAKDKPYDHHAHNQTTSIIICCRRYFSFWSGHFAEIVWHQFWQCQKSHCFQVVFSCFLFCIKSNS